MATLDFVSTLGRQLYMALGLARGRGIASLHLSNFYIAGGNFARSSISIEIYLQKSLPWKFSFFTFLNEEKQS